MSSCPRRPLRVVEFFSGVGGNALGLKLALEAAGLHESGVEVDAVASVDLSPLAIAAHALVFPGAKAIQKSVESVSVRTVDGFRADVWLMSPPCQPFSRQGQQKGLADDRSAALRHIIDVLLPESQCLPSLIFVENVKGFEESIARDALVVRLAALGFAITEHLWNPAEAPVRWLNSRLRYYLVGVRSGSVRTTAAASGSPQASMTASPPPFVSVPIVPQVSSGLFPAFSRFCTVGDVLAAVRQRSATVEDVPDDLEAQLLIPVDALCRSGRLLDIVDATATRTNCFTKNYGRKLEGAGSVFSPTPMENVARAFAAHESNRCIDCTAAGICPLGALGLRFFSPVEAAALMGFPSSFQLPREHTLRQNWMLLGNSVNPLAVAAVLGPALGKLDFAAAEP